VLLDILQFMVKFIITQNPYSFLDFRIHMHFSKSLSDWARVGN